MTQRTEKTKNDLYQLRAKLTRAQTGRQNCVEVPSGEQSKETRLADTVRGEGRRERHARLNRGRFRRHIFIKG